MFGETDSRPVYTREQISGRASANLAEGFAVALAYADIRSPRLAVAMPKAKEVEPGWELGQYIIEECWRRRRDRNIAALARAASVNRGTLIYTVKGFRGDGTPVEPEPNTLRKVAYGLALGDSNPDAGELIYERLMDLAGYLPRVKCQSTANDDLAQRQAWEQETREQIKRDLFERFQRMMRDVDEESA